MENGFKCEPFGFVIIFLVQWLFMIKTTLLVVFATTFTSVAMSSELSRQILLNKMAENNGWQQPVYNDYNQSRSRNITTNQMSENRNHQRQMQSSDMNNNQMNNGYQNLYSNFNNGLLLYIHQHFYRYPHRIHWLPYP